MPFWTLIVIVFVFCFMVKERREGKGEGVYFVRIGMILTNVIYRKTGTGLLIVMGMGVRGEIRLILAKSPKTYYIVNGQIQEDQRMLIEKLSIDFSRQPVTIQS